MTKRKDTPWTKKEICGNVIAIIISIGLATFILLIKSLFFLLFYWSIWLIIIVVGRALVCKHCDFLGEKCVTWCMGIIGSKLYKRSNKKDFTEIKIWKFWFDVGCITIALLFPLFVYIYYFFSEGLSVLDWMLIAIYLIAGIITFLYHTMCCKKCTVRGCPLGPKSN
ncbi:MAG: hypothetical protein EU535_08855 [Promethearchaeota archaeon]|nr:MAG: hypothetical protein EU535_08855 [Candidatus Lokiarchaeota archaeon]